MQIEDIIAKALENPAAEFSDDEARAFVSVLTNPGVVRFVGIIEATIQGNLVKLSSQDLSSDEGVRRAIKLQGEVAGLRAALGVIDEALSSAGEKQ